MIWRNEVARTYVKGWAVAIVDVIIDTDPDAIIAPALTYEWRIEETLVGSRGTVAQGAQELSQYEAMSAAEKWIEANA